MVDGDRESEGGSERDVDKGAPPQTCARLKEGFFIDIRLKEGSFIDIRLKKGS